MLDDKDNALLKKDAQITKKSDENSFVRRRHLLHDPAMVWCIEKKMVSRPIRFI